MYLLVINWQFYSVIRIETFIQIEYQAGIFKVTQNLNHEN